MSDNKKRKTMVSVLFMDFSIIFTVCLIASNILETKQMVFGPLHLTGGLLIFPISYFFRTLHLHLKRKHPILHFWV